MSPRRIGINVSSPSGSPRQGCERKSFCRRRKQKIEAGSAARRGRHENQDYQYRDHLGNIRMNYAFDRSDGQAKILKEDHYYPFGLIHKNYNSGQLDFGREEESEAVQLRQVPSNPNVYNIFDVLRDYDRRGCSAYNFT